MKAGGLLVAGAVSPFLFTATLSSQQAVILLVLMAILTIRTRLRMYVLFPMFFLFTTLAINHRLAIRLPVSENKSLHEITGVIGSLPVFNGDFIRFVFLPDDISAPVPPKIRVYWYRDRGSDGENGLPELHAGERWKFQLELRTTRGRLNFDGVDTERWLFTQGIGALAYVQAGENIRLAGPGAFDLQHWRETVLLKLRQKAGHVPAFRMLSALAVADRRGLDRRDRNILSATGTGHLLAISGLHVGLAAALGFYIGRILLLLLPYGIQQRVAIMLPWFVAWITAFAYSLLSGLGVSTQRALIMLSVATLVLLSRRRIHPLWPLMIAMVLVLLADPFAPLRAGFWFSFSAVAVLLMLFVPQHGPAQRWRMLLRAQVGISLTLAPLGIYWFQQSSLPGVVANLVAIPVVSMLVVPAILLSMLLLWIPGPAATWLLSAAGYVTSYLFQFLEYLSALQPVALSATAAPGLLSAVLAMLGAVIILLPRGIPGRHFAWLLMLPLFIPNHGTIAGDETRLDFLDVGQGLAVLLGRRDYLMVYDTGPGSGPGNGQADEAGWDLVNGTIQPMIRAAGRAPDLVVVSHADLDHAGGMHSLLDLYPDAEVLASLPQQPAGVRACETSLQWQLDGLKFRVLHPSPGLPYLGNDSSCVISVTGSGLSLLLTGDISRMVEKRLVSDGLDPHTVATVPHHGSSTSSSEEFIRALKPSVALVSAAANNRFGFPRQDVLDRYSENGTRVLNTAECGGIRVSTTPGQTMQLASARTVRKAIWRWPADSACP